MNMIDFSVWTKWIAIPVADDTTIGDFIDLKIKRIKLMLCHLLQRNLFYVKIIVVFICLFSKIAQVGQED